MELASYKVYPKQRPDFGKTINTYSRGRAKSEYFTELQDCWPNFSYLDLRCSKVGEPETSEMFIENAKYRNIPFAYCGMMVELSDGSKGFIVSHNSSANLNVLFINGFRKGNVMSCHPHHKIKYLDKKGEVIKEF